VRAHQEERQEVQPGNSGEAPVISFFNSNLRENFDPWDEF
jgi:hypothetical protein